MVVQTGAPDKPAALELWGAGPVARIANVNGSVVLDAGGSGFRIQVPSSPIFSPLLSHGDTFLSALLHGSTRQANIFDLVAPPYHIYSAAMESLGQVFASGSWISPCVICLADTCPPTELDAACT